MFIDKEKVREAKEKLGDRNAIIISEELNLSDFDFKSYKARCPFHQEDTASFIYNPKNYTIHCFGCQKTIDIIGVFMHNGMTYLESVKKLFKLAGMKYSFDKQGVKTLPSFRYPNAIPCNSKANVTNYLSFRGISRKTIDYADVREDDKGNIVFNYYDTNDVLTLVKYRPACKVGKGESKTWCQKGADVLHLLYNMNKAQADTPLLITEGEIDCLSAIESGYHNAVSVPFGAGSFQWIETNKDWLNQFKSIIVCSDNDPTGLKMQKEVTQTLGSWRTKYVDIPTSVGEEQTAIKDLNEVLIHCGKDAVLKLILSAKDTPVDSVIDFSLIQNVDLSDIDGIKTGFLELDKSLMKLFYGTINVVTGINGSGKTTFISQVIAHCLDQNRGVFLYSGELPNHQTKNWINFIFAGQRNVNHYIDPHTQADYWRVKPDALKAISDYYKNKLYIYKDWYDNRSESVLKSMEASANKYESKLFILDNLTAINLGATDANKYDKQADLIRTLIDFAKKLNVVIVLVVHPHKIETVRRLTKMDIQGISAIIDLTHRILSLYRVTKPDKQGEPKKSGVGWVKEPIKYDVLCDVLKDRMNGYEGETIGFYYDKPSKRFFTDEKNLDHQYNWDKEKYAEPLPFLPEQLKEGLF